MSTSMSEHRPAVPRSRSAQLPAHALGRLHERLAMQQLELEEQMRTAIAQLQSLRDGSDLVDPDVQAPLMSALRSLDESERSAIEVADALARVRSGAYGACARCGAAIAVEQLELRPTARSCIPCSR
jgi:DnaK suppressor protein